MRHTDLKAVRPPSPDGQVPQLIFFLKSSRPCGKARTGRAMIEPRGSSGGRASSFRGHGGEGFQWSCVPRVFRQERQANDYRRYFQRWATSPFPPRQGVAEVLRSEDKDIGWISPALFTPPHPDRTARSWSRSRTPARGIAAVMANGGLQNLRQPKGADDAYRAIRRGTAVIAASCQVRRAIYDSPSLAAPSTGSDGTALSASGGCSTRPFRSVVKESRSRAATESKLRHRDRSHLGANCRRASLA